MCLKVCLFFFSFSLITSGSIKDIPGFVTSPFGTELLSKGTTFWMLSCCG